MSVDSSPALAGSIRWIGVAVGNPPDVFFDDDDEMRD
jgi:hypothetical protein